MTRNAGPRLWIEASLAALTAFLFFLTLAWKEWIEAAFRVDADGGNGSLEWAIVGGLLVVSLAFAALARAEWRRQVATGKA
jgi:hypothetical protein